VQKVASQARRLYGGTGTVCLTGGLCDSAYIIDALSAALGTRVVSHAHGRYAGSVGAALCAMKQS